MPDLAAGMEMSANPNDVTITGKIKKYFKTLASDMKAETKHYLRIDGFPTAKELIDRGPRPKVMPLYYLCPDCDTIVQVSRHMECEDCGCTRVIPAHKPADPKHDIRRILFDAKLRMEEQKALASI